MRALALMLAALGACTTLDPNQGRFTCKDASDCGAGFDCKPQLDGTGLCFRPAECTEEVCNGLDDDCNGAVDDTFDLKSDRTRCGACDKACADGADCEEGVCVEVNCADGVDNDENGAKDCAEARCLKASCDADGGRCGARVGVPPEEPEPSLDGGLDGGAGRDGGHWSDGGSPLDAGSLDAGKPVDAGVLLACFSPERACANAFDDDGDGLVDCDDDDCAGRFCAFAKSCRAGKCE